MTLIFVINNMPPALFFTPPTFILLSLPHSEPASVMCSVDYRLHPHLSLQLLPSVLSHFVLPSVHLADLVTHRGSVCLHTVFLQFTHTHPPPTHTDIKSVWAEWKTQQLPLSSSLSVSMSALFVLWQDNSIVYRFRACLLSINFVYNACSQIMRGISELLFVCVYFCESDQVTCINHTHKKLWASQLEFCYMASFLPLCRAVCYCTSLKRHDIETERNVSIRYDPKKIIGRFWFSFWF